MGIDHRGHRVGGIMKPVDEFESQRDDQRETRSTNGLTEGASTDVRSVSLANDVQASHDQENHEENLPKVCRRTRGGLSKWIGVTVFDGGGTPFSFTCDDCKESGLRHVLQIC